MAKNALRIAIKQAKARARQELLATLDRDPWGRPYKMVMGRLRPWTPPAIQTMELHTLESTLAALLPQRMAFRPPFVATTLAYPNSREKIPPMTDAELNLAVSWLRAKRTALGSDGIPGRIWVLAMDAMRQRLTHLFNACIETGRLLQVWKTGRLVLLHKQGSLVDSPNAYRPIVLLNEDGKLLERIIARRLSLFTIASF